jgi:dolichyl-phosphate beta-glucosyltransferase
MNNIYLSIIIPAYNEEKRISASLDKIYAYFEPRGKQYEVILVDDGSTDKTVNISQNSSLAASGKLKIISNEKNRGKGFSVKNGILASHGEYVLFTDADLSTPISELEKLMKEILEGYDIVIASRSVATSNLAVSQPWYRQTMGRIFNLFVKALLFADYNDTQCGFKLFKGDIAREIAEKMKIEGFCFDVEMLYLAKKTGLRINETGVTWENSAESKVTVLNSSLSMFTDLLRIKKWHG